MKNSFNQQEVLIIKTSSFAVKQFCKKENNYQQSLFSHEEELEDACASGMIKELLPEAFNDNQKMYLWQLHYGFSFLELELGELPLAFEKELSLNPHNFFERQHYN